MPHEPLPPDVHHAVQDYAARLIELLAACVEAQPVDPELFLWNARRCMETTCHILLSAHERQVSRGDKARRELSLDGMISHLVNREVINTQWATSFKAVREHTNLGVHVRCPEREEYSAALANVRTMLPLIIQWLTHDSVAGPHLSNLQVSELLAAIRDNRAVRLGHPGAVPLQRWKDQCLRLQQALQKLEGERDELRREGERLAAKLGAVHAAEGERAQLEAQLRAYASQLHDAQAQRAATAAALARSQAQAESNATELERVRAAVSHAQAELTRGRAELAQAHAALAHLRAERAALAAVAPPALGASPPAGVPQSAPAPQPTSGRGWLVLLCFAAGLVSAGGVGLAWEAASGAVDRGSWSASSAATGPLAAPPAVRVEAAVPAAAPAPAAATPTCPAGTVWVAPRTVRLGQPEPERKDWPRARSARIAPLEVAGFCVQERPVTRAEFRRWVGSKDVRVECDWRSQGEEGEPVVCVDHQRARDYCGDALQDGRLASIAEWESLLREDRAFARDARVNEWAEDTFPPAVLNRPPERCDGPDCGGGMWRAELRSPEEVDPDGHLLNSWNRRAAGSGLETLGFRCATSTRVPAPG